MVGNVIQSLFTDANDYPAAAALSMILMVLIVVMVLVLRPPGRDGGAAVTRRQRARAVPQARGCRLAPQAPGADPRPAGAALHVRADLRGRADELQRPGQPGDLPVRRVHAGQLAQPVRARGHVRRARGSASRSGCSRRIGATILGTLAAFALVRHHFAGRSGANLLIFLPMAAPEIVMGSSLLALFVAAGRAASWGSGRSWSPTSCSACRSWSSPSGPGWPASTTTSNRRRWTSTPRRRRRSGG